MPEFRQLEMGISTNLYLPAIGTAGFDLCAVNGNNLVPAPPPNITDSISFINGKLRMVNGKGIT
jgi:hypothetical protein